MKYPADHYIRFFVRGEPKGQPRPRAFAMRTASGGFTARVFDAGTAEGWKAQIALAARGATPGSPWTGPLSLHLAFQMPRPRGHWRTGRHADQLKESAPLCHTGKPDADNLAKAVMDALTQLGTFWRDDAQIARLVVYKHYGVNPGVAIEIMPLLTGHQRSGE